ncbi:hypothetical protein BD311DRAFT_664644, partial [Dichomitus squalens]
VEKGSFKITANILGHNFRASTAGASPLGTPLMSMIWHTIYIVLPLWRNNVYSQLIAHRAQHAAYLRSIAILENLLQLINSRSV